jgi:hypothetical protein
LDLDSAAAADLIDYQLISHRQLATAFAHRCQVGLYCYALPFSPIHLPPPFTSALSSRLGIRRLRLLSAPFAATLTQTVLTEIIKSRRILTQSVELNDCKFLNIRDIVSGGVVFSATFHVVEREFRAGGAIFALTGASTSSTVVSHVAHPLCARSSAVAGSRAKSY